MLVDFLQIWGKLRPVDIVNSPLELHLHFTDFLRLLLPFRLEIEVVDVGGVE